MEQRDYEGRESLEVMDEAVRYNAFLQRMVIQAMPVRGQLLDFGAGRGGFATAIASPDLSVSCLEPDPVQQALIRRKGLTVVPSMAEVPDASLDGIYSLNVLEHLPDDVAAIGEWHRALRPGGKAFAYVPALQMLWSSFDDTVGHLRRYTLGSLKSLFGPGWRIEASAYADSLGVAAALAYRLTDSGHGVINRTALKIYDRLLFPFSRVGDFALKRLMGKNVFVVARKTN
jgi:SAM-dependent methyltransferase